MREIHLSILVVAVLGLMGGGCGKNEEVAAPEAQPTSAPEAQPTSAPEAQPTSAPEAQPTSAPEAETPIHIQMQLPPDSPTYLALFTAVDLGSVASALAKAGEIEQAKEVAQRVKRNFTIPVDIASALVAAGQIEQAVQMAQTIEPSTYKGNALSVVASALARSGEIERAIELARSIGEPSSTTLALADIASTLAELGDSEQAVAVSQQAVSAAEEMVDPIARAHTLRYVVWALRTAGDFEQGLSVADNIEVASHRSRALSAIAFAGDKEQVLPILNRALELAQTSEKSQRDMALSEVAEAMARAGEGNRAIEIAQTIESVNLRGLTQTRLAGVLAETGDAKQAIEVAQKIEKPSALRNVVDGLTKAGELEQAIELARTMEKRIWVLSIPALAMAKTGDVKESMELALMIRDESQTYPFDLVGRIASQQVEEGDLEQASTILTQVIEVGQRPGYAGAIAAIALTLATEPASFIVPGDPGRYGGYSYNLDLPDFFRMNVVHRSGNVGGLPEIRGLYNRRMKKAFTVEEKRLAKQLLEAMPEN